MQAFSLTAMGTNLKDIIYYFLSIIQILIPILFTLAFIVFFWGLSKFILSSGNDIENKKGKNYMIWGILALFILLTARAIIGLVSNEFQLGNPNQQTPTLPGVQENVSVKLNF